MPSEQGVIGTWGQTLAFISGISSPVQIGTGAAVVNGIPYQSDATINLTVTTPTTGTTGYAVVLRADYTAQTVRCVLKGSADGTAAIPSLTQNASIWEIYLHQFTITTGGVIGAINDVRRFIGPNTNLFYDHLGVITTSTISVEDAALALPATTSTTINFARTFSTIPVVLISAYGSSSYGNGNLFITSITSSSFTVYNSAPVTLNMSYQAFGRFS